MRSLSAEATAPFADPTPVDAYNAAIINQKHFNRLRNLAQQAESEGAHVQWLEAGPASASPASAARA